MRFVEKYILQNIPNPWYSKVMHKGGVTSIPLNNVKQGAAGYIIHAITISFTKASVQTFKVNNQVLLIVFGSANALPITHNILHATGNERSIIVTCDEPTTRFTVHYQYITNKVK